MATQQSNDIVCKGEYIYIYIGNCIMHVTYKTRILYTCTRFNMAHDVCALKAVKFNLT